MFRPPANACDCHIHVFGPFARYPLDAARKYTPEEARLDDYLKLATALGLSRAVFVQPSVYGTDNACQRDAIRRLEENARGVAVIDDAITDAQLGKLNGCGFVGARLNLTRAASLDSLEALAARVKEYDWHVQLHLPGAWLPEIADRLLRLPTEIVIDHFGRVDARHGVEQAAFQALLGLLDSGRVWVKLSAPYRVDLDGAPWRKAAQLARALVKSNPQRLVWGTDWPHPDVPVVPEDPALLDALADWVPEDALRKRILVDNPAKLYRF
ncbi:MAG: amidohydrolase family protein [Betaproteobacteria bacterium]|nr:amidohydrolase family protein [Betaproteobacteria bacterium]MDH5222298.1 amidohydrolase family protein [Betaproteobacteria bacterium]MDH5351019.1 amidohydrolase family protein [Betaproteobacteria bacterium]